MYVRMYIFDIYIRSSDTPFSIYRHILIYMYMHSFNLDSIYIDRVNQ